MAGGQTSRNYSSCRRRLPTRRREQHNNTSLIIQRVGLLTMTLLSIARGLVIFKPTRIRSRAPLYKSLSTTGLQAVAKPKATTFSSTPSIQKEETIQGENNIQPCKVIFDLQLPEGHCLGLQLDSTDYTQAQINEWVSSNCLHPAEVSYAMAQASDYTQQTFLLGRLAMRQLLSMSESSDCKDAILKDNHGRPRVPPTFLGSISHKRCRTSNVITGVALLSPFQPNVGVGIDIELASPGRSSIAKRVLTEHEMNSLGQIEGVSQEEEVLLRFSLKEAFYKAIHPLICQYVGFQEAEVIPHANGTATVDWNLNSGAHKQFKRVLGHWRRIDDFFLSSASVSLCETGAEECVVDEPLEQ